MKLNKIFFTIFLWVLSFQIEAQGLPPGWSYDTTPITHIISIPLSSVPNINGYNLDSGDYIGVFYINNQGIMECGGAQEWWGDQNVGIIAYGDDSWSTVKDGFSPNELINWKVYSWRVNKEYSATATYNTSLPNSTGLFVSNGLSGLTSLNAYGLFVWATVNPDTACQGMPVNLNAEPSGSSGYEYAWSSIPTGFNSNLPNPIVFPNIGTKYVITVTASGDFVRDTLSPVINPGPMGFAGQNSLICENQFFETNASATNYSSLSWETSGDGIFSDPGVLNTNYLPGLNDISSGSVILTLNIFPIEPCSGEIQSSVVLDIQKLPIVNAGDDQTICVNEVVELAGSESYSNTFFWTTAGDGTFSNSQILNPVYFPGTNDIENGSVLLELSSTSVSPCVEVISDHVLISFSSLAIVNSGIDQIICEDSQAELSATASNYSSVSWSSHGDGVFSDPSALNSFYTPGIEDIANGTSYLVLTAVNILPCAGEVRDSLLLTIQSIPVVNAGNDTTIATGQPVNLYGVAAFFTSVLWTTSGDGLFSDPLQLTTVYQHGPADKLNGGAELTLSAEAILPCVNSIYDNLYVTLDSTVFISETENVNCFLFPNPAQTEITIGLQDNLNGFTIKIIDISGRFLHQFIVGEALTKYSFNIEFLENGVYWIQIISGNSMVQTEKVVILR